MKKILSFLLVISVFSYTAKSQKLTTFLTVHGGFASAPAKDAKLSYGFAADLDFAISKQVHFNFMPALNFRGYTGLVTVKTTYIDLPVNIEFSIGESSKHVFVGVGGYVGFAIAGQFKNTLTTSGNTDWQKMSFGEKAADNRSPIDYGALINVGAYLPTNKGAVKAGVQTMLGLKNVVPKDRQNEPNTSKISLRNITAFVAFSIFNKK
jgi:Outer membrane protein beta-barrel domain